MEEKQHLRQILNERTSHIYTCHTNGSLISNLKKKKNCDSSEERKRN